MGVEQCVEYEPSTRGRDETRLFSPRVLLEHRRLPPPRRGGASSALPPSPGCAAPSCQAPEERARVTGGNRINRGQREQWVDGNSATHST